MIPHILFYTWICHWILKFNVEYAIQHIETNYFINLNLNLEFLNRFGDVHL